MRFPQTAASVAQKILVLVSPPVKPECLGLPPQRFNYIIIRGDCLYVEVAGQFVEDILLIPYYPMGGQYRHISVGNIGKEHQDVIKRFSALRGAGLFPHYFPVLK